MSVADNIPTKDRLIIIPMKDKTLDFHRLACSNQDWYIIWIRNEHFILFYQFRFISALNILIE